MTDYTKEIEPQNNLSGSGALTSGGFSCALHSNPIFLDHVATRIWVHIPPVEGKRSNERKPVKYIGPRYAFHVSDPTIYNHPHGDAILRVAGRKCTSSNGTRLFRAEKGLRPPHWKAKGGGHGHDSSIENFEGQNNQLSDSELKQIALDPLFRDAPYRTQLNLFLEVVYGIKNEVISKYSTPELCKPGFREDHGLSMIELYIEIPTATRADQAFIDASRETLLLAFGQPTQHRLYVKAKDEEDEDALITWVLPITLISPRLRSKKKAKVKFYRKGSRIRIELQVQSPSAVKVGRDHKGFLDVQKAEIPHHTGEKFAQRSLAVAEEIAKCLRLLERHFVEACKQTKPNDVDALCAAVHERIGQLAPGADTGRTLKFAQHLASVGHCERRVAVKKFKLQPELLRRLTDNSCGFLREQNRGSQGLAGKHSPRRRNPMLILEADWLKRTGRPPARKTKTVKRCSCGKAPSSLIQLFPVVRALVHAEGSVVQHPRSAFYEMWPKKSA